MRNDNAGNIPCYATHIDGVAKAAKYIKAGGWIGVGLGGVASYSRVQEACASGREDQCERVKYTEAGAFLGGLAGGAIGGSIAGASAMTVCGAIGMATAGVGAIACGLVVVGAGSIAGTRIGTSYGERIADAIYEITAP